MFGSWAQERIDALAGKLAEKAVLIGDGFKCLPPAEDTIFWEASAAACSCTNVNQLSAACHAELESLDFSELRPDRLYIADRASASSRLARAILRLKAVIVVHGQEKWTIAADNNVHHVNTTLPLVDQLVGAVQFCGSLDSAPTLICSETGRGTGALVSAAILAAFEGFSSPEATKQVEMRRGGPLRIEVDDAEELEQFCQRLLLAEFDLLIGKRGKPSSMFQDYYSTPRQGPSQPPPQSPPQSRSPLKRPKQSSPSPRPVNFKLTSPKKPGAKPRGPTDLDAWSLDAQ